MPKAMPDLLLCLSSPIQVQSVCSALVGIALWLFNKRLHALPILGLHRHFESL